MDLEAIQDRSSFVRRVAWLEPVLLATLGLNAMAIALDAPEHSLMLGGAAAALGVLGLVQLVAPTMHTPMVLARACVLLVASFVFLVDRGASEGFVLNALVVACTAYAFLLPGRLGFVVPAASALGYATLVRLTDDDAAMATVLTRCSLLAVVAMATHRLRRSYERDDARLRDSYRRLTNRARHERAVLEALPHPTAVVGDDGVLHGSNQRWRALCADYGLDPGIGMSLLVWLGRSVGGGRQIVDQLQQGMAELLTGRAVPFDIDVHLVPGDAAVDPESDEPWYQLTIAPLASIEGGAIVSIVDVSADVLNELMAERLRTDSLTGLANRLQFMEHLRQAAHPSRRSADQLAVLFIDLDHFKHVNDRLGHEAGDLLLIGAARRLREALRPDDVLARLGGDEFVALCRRVPDRGTAELVAGRLVAALEAPFDLPQGQATVSASIGIAMASRMHLDPDQLVRQADEAMYRAKRAGRGRGIVYGDSLIDLREVRHGLGL